MPSREEITNQKELLTVYRRNLAQYLRRRAMFGPAYVPPEVDNGIYDAGINIRRIKELLREWGVVVEDQPDDDSDVIIDIEKKECLIAKDRASVDTHRFGKDLLISTLELIRMQRLEEAIEQLQRLEEFINDFSDEIVLRILYNRACAESLLAEDVNHDKLSRDTHLDRAFAYLVRWLSLGQAGKWRETGKTPYNEVYRMCRDDDLHYLLSKKRRLLTKLIQEDLRNAFPKRLPDRTGGGGGCVPAGTLIRTPQGSVRVEDIREGDSILSVSFAPLPCCHTTRVSRVHTWRTSTCLRINNGFTCSPNQPIYAEGIGWAQASELSSGVRVLDYTLNYQLISHIASISDYFDLYNLTIDHDSHNFVADELVCHNKYKRNWI
jgi:hypothetical protein